MIMSMSLYLAVVLSGAFLVVLGVLLAYQSIKRGKSGSSRQEIGTALVFIGVLMEFAAPFLTN